MGRIPTAGHCLLALVKPVCWASGHIIPTSKADFTALRKKSPFTGPLIIREVPYISLFFLKIMKKK